MKKALLLSLIVAFAAIANAQTSEKKWGAAIGAGAYGVIDSEGIGLMPELYFSRYLSPKFDLLLKGELGVFNSKLTNDLDLAASFLNLRYKLTDESKKFRPYLFAGPGFLADNSTSGVTFNAGLGGKYYVGTRTALYVDGGYINGIESNNTGKPVRDNIWKATVGLEYNFGKAADSDKDGIPDRKDKCPNTPAGVAVDAGGCPIDTDGDGVADYLDDCPTLAGLTSLKGCPDKDKDGIADKDDACPDVAGPASLKGCPDTDGDGIADKDDKCPGTPKGWKTDANGCPLDQDKDGVPDAEDKCPTVAGPKGNNGCPVEEVKKEITIEQVEIQNITVAPVHFASNQSYLTDYSKGILDKLVLLLKENPKYNVNVYGHADSQGTDELNINLSGERAKSVVSYLISKGISEKRIIQQKAFGEAKPVASNDTPEGRLKNRRVEFEIFIMK
ncbi:MAG: OmpA family protein [Prolixibacteraceae bacterium]|nr:OmpA family protein [Prolixibacteraceae bacterium]